MCILGRLCARMNKHKRRANNRDYLSRECMELHAIIARPRADVRKRESSCGGFDGKESPGLGDLVQMNARLSPALAARSIIASTNKALCGFFSSYRELGKSCIGEKKPHYADTDFYSIN